MGTALLANFEEADRSRRFIASVLPSLAGWAALILPPPCASPAAGGFGGQWLYDHKHARIAGGLC